MWSDNLKSNFKIDGVRAEKIQSNNQRFVVMKQKLSGGNYVLM